MEQLLEKIPWSVAIFFCFTLGLAPFWPPHIVEKIIMLFKGRLVRPIDWFDLVMHGTPWVLLVLKLIYSKK